MTVNKKNILITGASRGIGLAIAKHFASDFNVYITARNEDVLKKLCSENGFKGYYSVDFYEKDSVKKLVNGLNTDFDILINNAGVYFYSPLEKTSNDELDKSIRLNVITAYELMQSVIPHMKKQSWGRIINTGSISGVMGEANAAVYSMTKSALIGLTKASALELAQDNITVNIINPGWVDTDLIDNKNLEEDFSKSEIIETIPQRRFVLPEEIAKTCEFLISDGARTVTGQSINICAGLSLGC